MSRPRHRPPAEQRRLDLATIHAAKKQLGLDDDTYRDIVERVAAAAGEPGIRSSAELSVQARRDLVQELLRLGGGTPAKRRHPGRPATIEPGSMLTRIEQLLTAMQLPWAYADALAKHMYRVDRVAWLTTVDQMRGVIAALDAEQKRRELRAGPAEASK
jgi:phage gp16-like protein